MVVSFTRRDLQQRYVGSVLGWPWPFIQPLMMLGVYYLVFNVLLDIKVPPAWREQMAQRLGLEADSAAVGSFQVIVLCCGLIPWLATAEFLVRSAGVILESGSMVKKVRFPSEILPVALIGSYVINMVILFTVFLAFTWGLTLFRSPLFWLFPVVVVLHLMFMLGLGFLLATANVFVRDVGQLVPIFINLWFFLSPIVYLREMLVNSEGEPATWLWVFDWNPLTYLMDLYRWTLVFPEEIRLTIDRSGQENIWIEVGMTDVFRELGIFAAIAISLYFIGYHVFMANKHRFADEL